MLDIGCGRISWQPLIESFDDVEYICADIVAELSTATNKAFWAKSHKKLQLVALDVLQDTLPQVDLVLAYDFFNHLTPSQIKSVLQRLDSSGSRYLVASNSVSQLSDTLATAQNKQPLGPIDRKVNLMGNPYNVAEPLEFVHTKPTVQPNAGKLQEPASGNTIAIWQLPLPHVAHVNKDKQLRMARFTSVFMQNSWGDGESRSGSGSTIEYTKSARAFLSDVFKRYNIKKWNTMVLTSCLHSSPASTPNMRRRPCGSSLCSTL